MSKLPQIESILLEIYQSLGCPGIPSKKKEKFSTGQKRIADHTAMGIDILSDIFEALGMGPEDPNTTEEVYENVRDIGDFAMEFANAYKCVELESWTFVADDRQIVWALLGYLFVPGLARYTGIRSTEKSSTKLIPTGRFWYLPELRTKDGEPEVYLPVAQVMDWLLDLLGLSVEKFADEHCESNHSVNDGLRRSMYNWRNETTIQSGKIEEYFSDATALDFKGAFLLDSRRTPAEQFCDALAFVKRKKLTANTLLVEIPRTLSGRLEEILDGRVGDVEQAAFVNWLLDRYSAPSMHTVRQRLIVARAVQDGYGRLLKFLCPDVDKKCSDVQSNKLLQLVAIYKYVFKLTTDAASASNGQGAKAEGICFESLLPEWSKCGLFLSIVPSLREAAMPKLARLLSRQFFDMRAGTELEDHFWLDAHSAERILKRYDKRTMAFQDEQDSEQNLLARMNTSSPWRALQGEQRFWVVSQLAVNPELKPRARKIAVKRLRELAESPAESVQAILLELADCLDNEGKQRQKDMFAKVQSLLNEAEATEGFEFWKAPLLHCKARHLLACNDFKEADKLFRDALDACQERNFGNLSGEIALNCFAIAVADQKLNNNNHEKYYRHMLAGGIMSFSGENPLSIEETARGASNYFWDELYKPYPEFPRKERRSLGPINKLFENLIPLLLDADVSSLRDWIKTNRKLLNSNLPDVDGNSVLMLLVKIFNDFRKTELSMRSTAPLENLVGVKQLEAFNRNGRQFLELLASELPNQLDVFDLKKQTPLMLMAEGGDTAFVTVLLKAGANPDIQDWQGMTALHAAIKSRVDDCVDTLLDHPCSTDLCTQDGRSPLHTASLYGNLHTVKRLLELSPELAWQRHADGKTPLEEVETWLEDADELPMKSRELARSGIRCSTKEELECIAQLLEDVPPVK